MCSKPQRVHSLRRCAPPAEQLHARASNLTVTRSLFSCADCALIKHLLNHSLDSCFHPTPWTNPQYHRVHLPGQRASARMVRRERWGQRRRGCEYGAERERQPGVTAVSRVCCANGGVGGGESHGSLALVALLSGRVVLALFFSEVYTLARPTGTSSE